MWHSKFAPEVLDEQVEDLNKRKKAKADEEKLRQEKLKENREKDELTATYRTQKKEEEEAYRKEIEVEERAEKASMPEQIRIQDKENLRKQERKEKQIELDANDDLWSSTEIA